MNVLSSEQAEKFYRDGYLRFGRVLDPSQVEDLLIAFDRAMNDEANMPAEFKYGHDRPAGTRAIHQFLNMWKISPEFRAVMDHPTITGAVGDLMDGSRVRIWHDQIISKPPHDNAKFNMHHDFYFWPLDRPTMISCWLALDDATVDNGCMHVVPGSHRDPRYQPVGCDLSADIHLAPNGTGEPASLYDDIRTWDHEKCAPVELKAGECMFHHCLNYHMTPPNVTERQRRAFVMIFMPDGTRFNRAQSPNHPCTAGLPLEDGQPMNRDEFPICGLA